MTKAELITIVLDAPLDRYEDIEAAARGLAKVADRIRPGTAKEAAAILGYECTRSVHRLVSRGVLTPIRMSPRRIRFDLNACQRLAETGVKLA